ncbi:hypothetical protein CLU79DRAFT_781792 [Phycomyces nitens]|nr:hypothetical protein CLU79DRAFT_781792 [Phycomyces nitens]
MALCQRPTGLMVNPSLLGNRPVVYTTFQVQPRLTASSRLLCNCRAAPDREVDVPAASVAPESPLDPIVEMLAASVALESPVDTVVEIHVSSVAPGSPVDPIVEMFSFSMAITNPVDTIVDMPVPSVAPESPVDTVEIPAPSVSPAGSVTAAEVDGDWTEDIVRAKSKIETQIKRKFEEIEELRKKLRILDEL